MDDVLQADDTNNRDAEKVSSVHLWYRIQQCTYKVPTINMAATPIFFFQCNLSLRMYHIGMPSIQKSKMILMAAFAQPIDAMLKLNG